MIRRLAVAVAALGVLAVACADSGTPTATPTTANPTAASPSATSSSPSRTSDVDSVILISVRGGKVSRPSRDVSVRLNGTVRIQVEADVSDEVHVHGYDIKARVNPGTPTVITFTANVPGGWAVELHDAKLHLVDLQVR